MAVTESDVPEGFASIRGRTGPRRAVLPGGPVYKDAASAWGWSALAARTVFRESRSSAYRGRAGQASTPAICRRSSPAAGRSDGASAVTGEAERMDSTGLAPRSCAGGRGDEWRRASRPWASGAPHPVSRHRRARVPTLGNRCAVGNHGHRVVTLGVNWYPPSPYQDTKPTSCVRLSPMRPRGRCRPSRSSGAW